MPRPPIMKPFKPAWWLSNGNLQTIWASKIPRESQVSYHYEKFMLPDGDHTHIAWHGHVNPSIPNKKSATPIVVVLHGLEGSAESFYAKGLMNQISQIGWRGAVMHFRGCHQGPNRLQRSYHSGDTEDLRFFLAYLSAHHPNAPIYLVGYSLGGNVLLKYLGEESLDAQVAGAVAVSVPFELSHASEKLTQGLSQLYQHVLLTSLKDRFIEKFQTLPCPIDKGIVKTLKTIWEYDDVVTAPLHGFTDAADYYAKSSCRQYLKHITTNTLILHAKDDPLVPPSAIPSLTELSSSTALECSTNGGHVAFIAGNNPCSPDYWLDTRIKEFLLEDS